MLSHLLSNVFVPNASIRFEVKYTDPPLVVYPSKN